MEHALLVTAAADLAHWEPRHARLYLGQDLCPRLLPRAAECDAVADFAAARGLRLTLVTPWADSTTFGGVARLLARLARRALLDEVVVNDYGVLALAARTQPHLALAIGRGLTYMNPVEEVEALAALGVRRMEYDLAVLRRHGRDPARAALPVAAYYPYAVTSSSRYCPTRGTGIDEDDPPGIGPCRKECRQLPPLPVAVPPRLARYAGAAPVRELVLKGNAVLGIEPLDLEAATRLGVTRLVYEPHAPI
jgi:hypothetical protein